MYCNDPYAAALLTLNSPTQSARNDAITTLMTLISPVARRTAARYRDHCIDPDDLVQAAQMQICLLALHYEYDPDRPAAALVVCVAQRAAQKAAKSLARQRPLSTLSLESDLFRGGNGDGHHTASDVLKDPDAECPLDAAADAHDVRLAVEILNTELSKFERAVWVARNINGMSYPQIAEALSVGRSKPYTFRSVDNAEQRARKKFERLQRVERIRESKCRIDEQGE